MDLFRRGGIVLLLVLLAGCATPYGERGYLGIGYDQAEVEPGVYFLDYTGDQYHSMAMVVGYWHKRAKELCPTGFTPIERQQGVGPGGGAIGGAAGGVSAAGFWQYPQYTGYIRCNK